ncbi:hypothetical protein GOBAR_AA09822 [Gossypium barbadense]|uniref:Uncharacterized protein n=1 Tax=Gossypium barbadense TaxID=3634 RepID=A0A2P5Y5I0_GOSBA|nr:hypothetical protein GOBAR_AA09822 [Gossypium barbadense]
MGRLMANKIKESHSLNKRLDELNALDPNDETLIELEEIKLALNLKVSKEEIFWEQRARVNWVKFVDKNTSFFHNFANQRKKRNKVKRLRGPNGGWITDEAEKVKIVTEYFKELSRASNTSNDDRVLLGINECIHDNMNKTLLEDFVIEDVTTIVKNTALLKASRLRHMLDR